MPEHEPLLPLTRDLRRAAATMSEQEARYLVDYYYQLQRDRIRAAQRHDPEEPHALMDWLFTSTRTLETRIRSALDSYSEAQPLGQWARSIIGIGPVIAAGLLAHIDISKAETAGAVWRFAGLDPTSVMAKGTKRPWNTRLKTLCWKVGESFVKQSGRDNDIYGHLYIERKVYEEKRNESGGNSEAVERDKARYGKDTEAYKAIKAGRLPQAQIHARAKRWAVKLFLAHYHHVGYVMLHDRPPPKPYVIEHMGHVKYLGPPNFP
jgi:hypothetical protein